MADFFWHRSMLHRLCRSGQAVLVVLWLSACGGGDEVLINRDGVRGSIAWVGPQAPQRDETRHSSRFVPEEQVENLREQARSTGGYSIDLSERETVRLFYKTVYKASDGVSSGWTGSVSTCTSGDTTANYKDAVLRRINWFRAMAGVPAHVQLDATFNRKAQQAALVMAANNNLNHYPPSSWTCNNPEATEAAGSANLALGQAGADSIAGYIEDSGSNNTAVGHRRWIFYPQTQTMGTGDVTGSGNSNANALWVFDNRFGADRPTVRDDFVAWPPPGYVPYTTVYPRWSFSYPNADFSTAAVSMSENGVPISARKEALSSGIGENTLVWLAGTYTDGMQWSRPNVGSDTHYTVQISGVKINGVSRSFSYTVKVFDPDVTTQVLTLNGKETATIGQSSSYAFATFSGATSYQWRSLQANTTTFSDGAEGDLSQFVALTTPGYNVQASGVAASGSRSLHLAHPQPVDQMLTLVGDWVPTAQTTLRFSSRLGLSSPNQRARVEVSQDGGTSWQTVFEQAGTQSGFTSSTGETTFTPKQVSLSAYVGRTVQLRFSYRFISGGSYYPQTSNSAGWFIDDIKLDAIQRVIQTGTPIDIGNNTQFSISPTQVGEMLLQVRPGMYGFYGDWSAVKNVSVQQGSGTSSISPTPPVTTVSTAAVDCLFSWAERNYPSLFPLGSAASQTQIPYRFRFYSTTQTYLLVSSSNQRFYLWYAGEWTDLGGVTDWLTHSTCQ